MINWMKTLLEEKNIDLEQTMDIDANGEWHQIPVGCVVEYVDQCDAAVKRSIKNTLVHIDVRNGDILHFIKHLAKGMALSY